MAMRNLVQNYVRHAGNQLDVRTPVHGFGLLINVTHGVDDVRARVLFCR